MTTNHIDTLKEWWENAEQVAPMRGDLVIEDVTDEYGLDYRIRNWPGDMKEKLSYVRVLEPKPKPAWHDAVAVIAHTARFSERRPFALTHTEDVLDPYNSEWITRDDLLNPTPLIEAKVTDEARERVWESIKEYTGEEERYRSQYVKEIDAHVRAALGLETK